MMDFKTLFLKRSHLQTIDQYLNCPVFKAARKKNIFILIETIYYAVHSSVLKVGWDSQFSEITEIF